MTPPPHLKNVEKKNCTFLVRRLSLEHQSFHFVFVFVEVCNEPSPSPITNHLPNTAPTKIFSPNLCFRMKYSLNSWNMQCESFKKYTRVRSLWLFVGQVLWKKQRSLASISNQPAPNDPQNKKDRTTYNVNI